MTSMDDLAKMLGAHRHARPPMYVLDPANWEWDKENFDGRRKTPIPADTSGLEKFSDALPTDVEPGIVWVTAEWTNERSGGGPGNVYESFTDAVADFDTDGRTYYGWHYEADGEWNPNLVEEDGEIFRPDEAGYGVPRVLRSGIIRKGAGK